MGRLIGIVAVVMLLVELQAGAEPTQSAAAVVELFTSEGCSDCPPADALLGELAGRPGVVALAYHVTYWDALGWHDRFSLPRADARQQYYVRQLRLPVAFTPQAVVDGRLSFIGSDQKSLVAALEPPRLDVPVDLARGDGQLYIELAPHQLPAPVSVVLVGYLPYAATAVGGGENGGRKLREFNTVRSYDVLGPWRGNARRFVVPLSKLAPEATRVAVLLQMPAGTIVGAATLTVR